MSNFDFTALLELIKSFFEAFRKLMLKFGFDFGPKPQEGANA